MRHLVSGLALAGMLSLVPAAVADEPGGTITDEQFVAKATSAGSAEVEAGKLALRGSQTEEVKTFAQRMITDHTKANQELLILAGKKRIPVPKQIDAKHQQMLDRLARLQGSELDKAYAEQMVKDHKEAVELFEAESRHGKDAELKAFADRTLPTLKEHHRMARKLAGEKDEGSKSSEK